MIRALRLVPVYVCLITLAALVIFPYLWIFLSSLKPYVEIFALPPTIIPNAPTLENYQQALGFVSDAKYAVSKLPQDLRNSLIAATASTAIVMALAVVAGYGFARIKFPFRNGFLVLILGLRMVPAIVLIVPIYLFIRQLGLLDTYGALIIIYTAFNIPFAVWLLSVFFQDLEKELEDAARVDGCTQVGVLRRIVLPLMLPSIAVVSIFVFIWCWNDFLFALILTANAAKTMPVGLNDLQSGYEIRWGIMTAGAVIHTIPAILFILFAQRYIISGMTLGAIKG
jgi:multiple sugar transport system permease protein